MNRSPDRPRLLLSAFALLPVIAGVVGCQPKDKTPPSQFTLQTGAERIPVKDDWREFALAHYAGELLVELPNATDVRFLQPVTVTAIRSLSTGRVQLITLGELDQTNREGKRLRHAFFVGWEQSGGGWNLIDRNIEAGSPAPPPPKPFDAPPASPSIVPPAAPADPALP